MDIVGFVGKAGVMDIVGFGLKLITGLAGADILYTWQRLFGGSGERELPNLTHYHGLSMP